MPPRLDDRWLWLGFGVFFFVAAHGIRYAIKDVVQLTKIERYSEHAKDEKDELPEDNITLDDLKTLAESPDPNIANAAISLIISRWHRQLNPYHTIMQDIDSSRDEGTQRRARQALKFLRTWPLDADYPSSSIPRYTPSPSNSGTTTPSLPALENAIGFAGIEGDGWADGSAVTGTGVGAVVPSMVNPVAGWTNVPRERPGESEVERRRRRREAMVFREGSGGVEESDIIRPVLER